MEVEEIDFKDKIIPKIKKATANLTSNKHPRILLCDFSSIQKKKMGPNYLFFNKTYKNLGYFWDKIQNQLIYLWDADEREVNK